MQPRMSANEAALFLSFLRKCDGFLEFGSGGSTVVASSNVKSWIITVDSSQAWLDKVVTACAGNPVKPKIVFADIGPVGDWGVPTDVATRSRWPGYHSDVWQIPQSKDASVYLVDGRFRVACFAQIVLHCRPDAIIGMHDFTSRANYHCVREIGKEIATAEDLSFFLPQPQANEKALSILNEYANNYG